MVSTAFLIQLSLLSYATFAVINDRSELVTSWIGVPNEGTGDIIIIDSETERSQSMNIETSTPSYIDASIDRKEFYVRDHETVYIYDSITLERLDVISTGCHGRFWQGYSEYMHQLWHVCDSDQMIMVLDVQTREITARISVDFVPHAVVALKYYAFVTGVTSVDTNHSVIIRKYSTETFENIDTKIIGDIIWTGRETQNDPHLFFDAFHSNPDYNHYVYSTIQSQNKLYKIDTNDLKTVQALKLEGAHGIYGTKNKFYIGNNPGSNKGVVYLIDSYNMTKIQTFDNLVMGRVHNLMLNCEETKLFVAHSGGDAISVFDVSENGALTGHRVIYEEEDSQPMAFTRICVYENMLTRTSVSNVNRNMDVIINLIGSVMGYGSLVFFGIIMILITFLIVAIVMQKDTIQK